MQLAKGEPGAERHAEAVATKADSAHTDPATPELPVTGLSEPSIVDTPTVNTFTAGGSTVDRSTVGVSTVGGSTVGGSTVDTLTAGGSMAGAPAGSAAVPGT